MRARARGIRLLHGSTTSVYADDTPYAESKRASEKAAGDATLLRFAFPYGPGQRRGAIPTMLRPGRRPRADRRLPRLGTLLLLCGRRGARRRAAARCRRNRGSDVGRDDDPRTLHEIAQLACRLADAPEEELIVLSEPPVGPAPTLDRLDLAGLRELGWQPEVALEDGMARTLDWLSSPA